MPPPSTVDEMNNACFIVGDKDGQRLGYFYFEEEPGRRTAANLLTKDEAPRLAVNFAKLPELLGRKPVRVCIPISSSLANHAISHVGSRPLSCR